MTDNDFTSHTEARSDPHAEPQAEPMLRRALEQPKGVLQKNLKTFVYLGAALLVIVAALFSSSGKKTPAQQAAAKGQPPQPTLQDNTDNNVQELKNQLQAEQRRERENYQDNGASSRVGRNVFCCEVRFAHCSCGRRSADTRGAPGKRPRSA